MNSKQRYYIHLVLVVSTLCLVGCGSPEAMSPASTAEQHDHDSHSDSHEHATSQSLDEMVSKVEELSSTIQEAFKAGDSDKGHGPLHEIGHLLEELPQAASKESLTSTQQQQLTEAVDSLMDSFGALDERLHGGGDDGKSIDDVSADIEAALTKLKSVREEEPAS